MAKAKILKTILKGGKVAGKAPTPTPTPGKAVAPTPTITFDQIKNYGYTEKQLELLEAYGKDGWNYSGFQTIMKDLKKVPPERRFESLQQLSPQMADVLAKQSKQVADIDIPKALESANRQILGVREGLRRRYLDITEQLQGMESFKDNPEFDKLSIELKRLGELSDLASEGPSALGYSLQFLKQTKRLPMDVQRLEELQKAYDRHALTHAEYIENLERFKKEGIFERLYGHEKRAKGKLKVEGLTLDKNTYENMLASLLKKLDEGDLPPEVMAKLREVIGEADTRVKKIDKELADTTAEVKASGRGKVKRPLMNIDKWARGRHASMAASYYETSLVSSPATPMLALLEGMKMAMKRVFELPSATYNSVTGRIGGVTVGDLGRFYYHFGIALKDGLRLATSNFALPAEQLKTLPKKSGVADLTDFLRREDELGWSGIFKDNDERVNKMLREASEGVSDLEDMLNLIFLARSLKSGRVVRWNPITQGRNALVAVDRFLKVPFMRAGIAEYASRTARVKAANQGLSRAEAQLAYENILNNPTKEAIAWSETFLRKATLTQNLNKGSAAEQFVHFIKSKPLLNIAGVPFPKTVVNGIRNYIDNNPVTFLLRTGFGATEQQTGKFVKWSELSSAQKDVYLGNAMWGATVMYAGFSLYQSGIITGSSPSWATKISGWQPEAFKVGDGFTSFERMGTAAHLLKLGSLMAEADLKNEYFGGGLEDRSQAYTSALIQGIIDVVTPQTVVDSFSEISQVISGSGSREAKAVKYAAKKSIGFIPVSSFLRSTRRLTDTTAREKILERHGINSEADYKRFTKLYLAHIKDSIPYVSKTASNTRKDYMGYEYQSGTPNLLSALLPARRTVLNATQKKIVDWHDQVGFFKNIRIATEDEKYTDRILKMPLYTLRLEDRHEGVISVPLNPDEYEYRVRASAGLERKPPRARRPRPQLRGLLLKGGALVPLTEQLTHQIDKGWPAIEANRRWLRKYGNFSDEQDLANHPVAQRLIWSKIYAEYKTMGTEYTKAKFELDFLNRAQRLRLEQQELNRSIPPLPSPEAPQIDSQSAIPEPSSEEVDLSEEMTDRYIREMRATKSAQSPMQWALEGGDMTARVLDFEGNEWNNEDKEEFLDLMT